MTTYTQCRYLRRNDERYAEATKMQEQERKVTNPANQHTVSSATVADLPPADEGKSRERAAKGVRP